MWDDEYSAKRVLLNAAVLITVETLFVSVVCRVFDLTQPCIHTFFRDGSNVIEVCSLSVD